ncbi:Protein FAR1-RELATED SEQUENCE 5 [Platanthera zijinensis]|uniref:Protein FAR1-RELATED SEQUENCE 5 n=1 Tax=Platanthera zijinensis TaxID=2320716 RepID=A0AAP0AVK1_9ASPA
MENTLSLVVILKVLEDFIPYKGKEFSSDSEAYTFYNEYARRGYFGIRKEYANKCKKTKKLTSRRLVCDREGFLGKDNRDHQTNRARSETRFGCNARVTIVLIRETGMYVVSDFVEEHNHHLHNAATVHIIPSQRNMSAAQEIEADIAHESGIRIKDAYHFFSKQVGGSEGLGFTRRDQKNYLRTKRQRSLMYGEASSIERYFSRHLKENPSYYYAIQLDSKEQITNIFWADARMILDYSHFGDVITFDTTYGTNNAASPLGVFLGLNHHQEAMVFGGALLYDETIESFIWLFETFLEAMNDKKPMTIMLCVHIMQWQ